MNETIYNLWNIKKIELANKVSPKTVKERDVVFLCIGENIGCEENGKGKDFLRPVLVMKKFSSAVFFGIPLTTKKKKGVFYESFWLKSKESTALLSQMRLFDTKRISYFYGRISVSNYQRVKEKLMALLQ